MSGPVAGEVGFVLVHGGGMSSRVWRPLLGLLEAPAAVVDLPGRRLRPADLSLVTTADWVSTILDEVEQAPFASVVLVGHSSAGYAMPQVALAARRLHHLVFVSCTVPAPGTRPVDFLRPDIREMTVSFESVMFERARGCTIGELDPGEAPPATDLRVVENQRGEPPIEAPRPLFEVAGWTALPRSIPRTYVLGRRDKVIPPELARVMVDNMGGAEVVELDTGHHPMAADPEGLAAVLNSVARRVVPGRSLPAGAERADGSVAADRGGF